MCLKHLRVCDLCEIWLWDFSEDIRKSTKACGIYSATTKCICSENEVCVLIRNKAHTQ